MAKWYGEIGFIDSEEIEPGLWAESAVIKREYFGDLISPRWKRFQNNNTTLNEIEISNEVSIVADPYAIEHCSKMAYVNIHGTRWKVTGIEIQYPRLLISVGGIWHDDAA